MVVDVRVGLGLRRSERRPDWALAYMDRTLPPCDVAVIKRREIRAGDAMSSPGRSR